jgi:acetyltransferase-like isoleucine patch superfamily enzyme
MMGTTEMPAHWVHPTAIIESDVTLGSGTKVWDSVHIRRGAQIGRDCIIGEKTYIAYDCVIGDFVKINASAYICAGVTINDFCMIAAHVVFTNDRYPRAGNHQLTGLQTSEPTDETLLTCVEKGVTIGANATIGPGVRLGAFCMIGMGAVVTHDIPAYRLAVGNPARLIGWVCACGQPLNVATDVSADQSGAGDSVRCRNCDRQYLFESPEQLVSVNQRDSR